MVSVHVIFGIILIIIEKLYVEYYAMLTVFYHLFEIFHIT